MDRRPDGRTNPDDSPLPVEAEGSGGHDTDPIFDYSSPEAISVLSHFSEMVYTIRSEYEEHINASNAEMESSERKIRLYERSLGLAVLPVLLRRGLIVLKRKASK